jgi:hypothetical protein
LIKEVLWIMIVLITKTLKSGRMVIVKVEQTSEAQQKTCTRESPPVDAVTTATFGNYSRRMPPPVPLPKKKRHLLRWIETELTVKYREKSSHISHD